MCLLLFFVSLTRTNKTKKRVSSCTFSSCSYVFFLLCDKYLIKYNTFISWINKWVTESNEWQISLPSTSWPKYKLNDRFSPTQMFLRKIIGGEQLHFCSALYFSRARPFSAVLFVHFRFIRPEKVASRRIDGDNLRAAKCKQLFSICASGHLNDTTTRK